MTLAFHKISRIRGIPDNEEIGISFQSWYCDFSIIKELLYLIVHYILIWIVLLLFPNIEIQKQLLEKEGEKKMNDLQNEIIKDREENQANVDAYKKQKSEIFSADLEISKAAPNQPYTHFFTFGFSGGVWTQFFDHNSKLFELLRIPSDSSWQAAYSII